MAVWMLFIPRYDAGDYGDNDNDYDDDDGHYLAPVATSYRGVRWRLLPG